MSAQTPFFHTGVQCLTAIAQHHGLQVNPERLIADYALGNEEPCTLVMLRMATDIGLKAKIEALSWDGLRVQDGVFPFIAYTRSGGMVIVVGISQQAAEAERVAILDPSSAQATVQLLDESSFAALWGGQVILLKREHKLTDPEQKFGFSWFISTIIFPSERNCCKKASSNLIPLSLSISNTRFL